MTTSSSAYFVDLLLISVRIGFFYKKNLYTKTTGVFRSAKKKQSQIARTVVIRILELDRSSSWWRCFSLPVILTDGDQYETSRGRISVIVVLSLVTAKNGESPPNNFQRFLSDSVSACWQWHCVDDVVDFPRGWTNRGDATLGDLV